MPEATSKFIETETLIVKRYPLIFFKSVLLLGITFKSLRCITLFMLGYKYTDVKERERKRKTYIKREH